MEDTNVQHGARPKQSTDQARCHPAGFGQFCLAVESLLTCSQSETLATWFDYPPAKIEKISNSDNPSRVLVQFMEERGEINPTDISTFISALQSENVCLSGVAVKVKEAFQKYLVEAPPSTVTEELREKKRLFKEQLMTKYTNMCGGSRPVPYLPKTFSIEELYVESGAIFLEKSRDNKEKWTCLESCRGILTDSRVKSKRRVLEGEAGMGKTTFGLQVAHDWVNNHEALKDVEILILLRLRQYKNVSSIYSVIKRALLPKESELSEEDIEQLLRTFQSSTLIILDGYDEYPEQEKNDTDIHLIIMGDMFPNCEVIVTSRMQPRHSTPTTQRIKLTGFDDAARDAYIEKAVVGGNDQAAKSVKEFFSENPVSKYLCYIPLFFAMVAHMAHWFEQFKNIKKVTKLFEKIVACLHSHELIRETGTGQLAEGQQSGKHDSKLNEIAYEGLSNNMVVWKKGHLCQLLGEDLYDDYVRIGILVEEEVFDFDSCATTKDVYFCHKLFQEWFAAQYVAQEAAKDDVRFEPWPDPQAIRFFFDGNRWNMLLPPPVAEQGQKLLKSPHPVYVNYMYQFACGLNSDAALKIIEHLGKEFQTTWPYTLLCIKEWNGNLESIFSTVTSMCAHSIVFNDRELNSTLHEESAIEILRFASRKKIPILRLVLGDCLDVSVLSSGILQLKRSNLSIPVLTHLEELQIFEMGAEITEEKTDSIFKYSSNCAGLKVIMFFRCLLPRYIKVPEPLRSRDITVLWIPSKYYILNLESGVWETTGSFGNWDERNLGEECKAAKDARANRGAQMTDDEYEGTRRIIGHFAKNKV